MGAYSNSYYDLPNSLDMTLQTALNTELSTLGQLDFNNDDDWDSIQIINNDQTMDTYHRRMQDAAAAGGQPEAKGAEAGGATPEAKGAQALTPAAGDNGKPK